MKIIPKTISSFHFDLYLSESVPIVVNKHFINLDKDGILDKWCEDLLDDLDEEQTKYVRCHIDLFKDRKPVACLAAPTFSKNGKLYLRDGKRVCTVQHWVEKHDGEYACLILWCSNDNLQCLGPKSKCSLLVVSKSYPSILFAINGFPTNIDFELLDPVYGDLYEVDMHHALRSIRSRVAAKKRRENSMAR